MKTANTKVYSSDALRKLGDILLNATTFRFDGSDLMPGPDRHGRVLDRHGRFRERQEHRRHYRGNRRGLGQALGLAKNPDPAYAPGPLRKSRADATFRL